MFFLYVYGALEITMFLKMFLKIFLKYFELFLN